MAKLTIEGFLARLRDSEILTADQFASLQTETRKAAAGGDTESFVKSLVKDRLLTAYQARRIWKNQGKSLALGNYLVADELGRGGMGVVLKASHRRMQREVAVKVLPKDMVKDPAAIARFQREVVAAAQLSHPNIVAAYDADQIDGQHILVMEFVNGRDLSSLIKQKGPVSIDQAVDCIVQAARGLEFAHSRGVIHRDIKPANLLLDEHGTVKILDMGLARFSDAANVGQQAELTGTGAVMGTVDYMSPEQAIDTKSADARSDIYSLGISLYYLLTGQPAYTGDSLMARLLAHANQPIPKLNDSRDDVPANLQAVFEKMVAKRPEDRYQSMSEVLTDLATCSSDRTGTALVASAPVTGDDSSGGLTAFLNSLEQEEVSYGSAGRRTVATRKQQQASHTSYDEATLVSAATSATLTEISRNETGTAQRKVGTRRRLQDKRWLAGIGAIAVVALLSVVILLTTSNGTLRIEVNDPQIEVSVKGTDIVLKGVDKEEISLAPGEHTLHVTRGDFEFDTDSLVLKKGESILVKVELLEGVVQVARDGKVITSRKLMPEPAMVSSTSSSSRTPATSSPATSSPPTSSRPISGTQRELAEWLKTLDAHMNTAPVDSSEWDQGWIAPTDPLPAGDLSVTALSLLPVDKPFSDRELSRLASLKQLVELKLQLAMITGTGFGDLVELPLRRLELSLADGYVLVDEAYRHIARMSRLQTLSLPQSALSVEHIQELAQLKNLHSLNLYSSGVSDEVAAAIAREFPDLRVLEVSGTGIGDAGLRSLAGMKHLETLFLSQNSFTVQGLKPLESMQSLRVLSLSDTETSKLSVEAIKSLSRTLPDCNITYANETGEFRFRNGEQVN